MKKQGLLIVALWGMMFVLQFSIYFVLGPILVAHMATIDTRPPRLTVPDPDFGWQWKVPIVATPADHPPNTIHLARVTYQIRYGSPWFMHQHRVIAFTDPVAHVIYLNPKFNLREEMMHELLHVLIFNDNPIDEIRGVFEQEEDPVQSSNHSWIVPLSPVLLEFVQENPNLMKWIEHEPKDVGIRDNTFRVYMNTQMFSGGQIYPLEENRK